VYTIVDQFLAPLPGGVPVNEQWTTGVTNDVSNNWRRGAEGSFNASTSSFADGIDGETSNRRPTPVCDPNNLNSQAVYHWGQAWQVGSLTIGAGKRVQTNVLQKYVGRALHTNIVQP